MQSADGTETMVTVQVDPTWNVITSPASNICIGGNVTFSATLNNAGTGTVQWVRSATSMGVGTVVTSPDAPGVGTYYYRPQYVAGYGGCNLADGTETLVTVHPFPVLTSTLTPDAICSGSVFSYSPTTDLTGTTFMWANWCNNVSNTYIATSSSSTATFAWTRAAVTGISNLAGSGSTVQQSPRHLIIPPQNR
jgi:hypothetical protein